MGINAEYMGPFGLREYSEILPLRIATFLGPRWHLT